MATEEGNGVKSLPSLRAPGALRGGTGGEGENVEEEREHQEVQHHSISLEFSPEIHLFLKDTGGWHDQRNEQLAADNSNATRVCVSYTTAALRRLSLSKTNAAARI